MMARIIIVAIIVLAVIAGGALYYLQVYAYYTEVDAADVEDVQLTGLINGELTPIEFENFKAIDSDSSPIRYRACFETPLSQAMLSETFVPYAAAEPLVAPRWFDCFDADAIGAALASGAALPFLAEENIAYGIDRVIAVMADGRAYAWHQINRCGEVVFDGNPAPEGCPPAPESLQ